MKNSDSIHNNKRLRLNHLPNSSVLPRKKHRDSVVNTGFIYLKPLEVPLISTTTGSSCESIRLEPYRPCTIGRNRRRCEFVFEDRRVSNRHCQVLFDALNRRIYITDGVFFFGFSECSRVRVSLNGVFVNGVRIGRGEVAELSAGDEVCLVCGNEGVCSSGIRIGFVVERIVIVEEVVHRSVSDFRLNGLSSDYAICGSECGGLIARANLLLSRCREILRSADPISYTSGLVNLDHKMESMYACRSRVNKFSGLRASNVVKFRVGSLLELKCDGPACGKEMQPSEGLAAEQSLDSKRADVGQLSSVLCQRERLVGAEVNSAPVHDCVHGEQLQQIDNAGGPFENDLTNKPNSDSVGKDNAHGVVQDKQSSSFISPPGNKFYLNRLQFMDHGWPDHPTVITLPELLYPVERITKIFIATFTSDVLWFLSYCEVPHHLPVTIACHNTERCWSSSPDKRMSVPYSDFPNLVVVYPPFPEIVAFGKDHKISLA